jgi:hypothetical protein
MFRQFLLKAPRGELLTAGSALAAFALGCLVLTLCGQQPGHCEEISWAAFVLTFFMTGNRIYFRYNDLLQPVLSRPLLGGQVIGLMLACSGVAMHQVNAKGITPEAELILVGVELALIGMIYALRRGQNPDVRIQAGLQHEIATALAIGWMCAYTRLQPPGQGQDPTSMFLACLVCLNLWYVMDCRQHHKQP